LPKSPEGKARSARRGYKGGQREGLRAIARLLREKAKALEHVSQKSKNPPKRVLVERADPSSDGGE
jgi:hypothetical protein